MSSLHTHRGSSSRTLFGQPELSLRAYVSLVVFYAVSGLSACLLGVRMAINWDVQWWVMLVVGIAAIIFGCIAAAMVASGDIFMGFVAMLLMAIWFGLLMSPIFAALSASSLLRVFGVILIAVVLLGIIGVCIPKSLGGLHGVLIGLTLLLVVAIFCTSIAQLAGVNLSLTPLDIAGIVLFGAWVIVDVNMLFDVERTHEEALLAGMNIFLDIINLSVYALEIIIELLPDGIDIK